MGEEEERRRGRGPSDSKDGCFTLKTWKVKNTIEQRLTGQCKSVFRCWLDRAQGSQAKKRAWLSLSEQPSHVCPPLLFPSADHQRPEAACDCGGHATDRPVHPDLLAGCGPPAEDRGEIQHGGKRPRQGGGRQHHGDIQTSWQQWALYRVVSSLTPPPSI